MTRRHPTETALHLWSEGTHRRHTRHVRHCPLCLERLERMTELDPRTRSEIEASLVPERSLEEAVWHRLEARAADSEALSVMTELLDVGPETTLLLLGGVENEGDVDE